ncbi:hypothetical protein EWM64_g2794 [Hericium alpestre]|uniref:Uncharacterized protein n=1 Tax=Hericium alpestre TaxID=135208 RepID=A0A4Z0A2E7_9AGAM|nr:hypothetical protein EWM64_g2794 [Hericium alpestre]
MHALKLLSAPCLTFSQVLKAQRYVALCQAHSRLVLLLQSLIHSSSLPFSEEPDDTRWTPRTSPKQNSYQASVCLRNVEGSAASLRGPSNFETLRGDLEELETHAQHVRVAVRRWKDAIIDTTKATSSVCFHSRIKLVVTGSELFPIYSRSWDVPSPPTSSSLHDIRMATSRLRAPILRVFHPCTEVDENAIVACETQLDEAGLWEHLSTGDIVCNLGYMPAEEEHNSSSDVSSEPGSPNRVWLLFDGQALVPYAPPAQLPLADPLTLPSPLYYAHIFPPPTNPTFMLTLPHSAAPQLSLVHLPVEVRSPQSPSGFVRVKRYKWIAHLPAQARPGLGEGWQGQWVLEGEGTTEGKAMLLEAIRGAHIERKWELVVEKSNGARTWLRLLST